MLQLNNLSDAGLKKQFSPECVFETLQRLIDSGADGVDRKDRRISIRKSVLHPVKLTPVSTFLEPYGPPFDAVVRDVSISGIGWISVSQTNSEYLIATLFPGESDSHNVIVKLVHQQRVGPIFFAGGSVIVDWSVY